MATCFLVGPCVQCQRMFDDERRVSAILLLLAMIGTLVVSFLSENVISANVRSPLILLLILTQFLSFLWYSLSYIPFARTCVKSYCANLCPELPV